MTTDRGLNPLKGSKHGASVLFTKSRNVSPVTCPSQIIMSSSPSVHITGIAVIRGPCPLGLYPCDQHIRLSYK